MSPEQSGLLGRRLAGLLAGWTAAMTLFAVPARAAELVHFDSLDRSGPAPVSLLGHWFAAGSQPAPAVVLLHGCGGPYDRRGELSERMRRYTALLNAQGLHALVLDSLRPRGEKELCTQRIGTRQITQAQRRLDALAALAWLAARSDVDPARLGLLGWSNGGSTVLAAINENNPVVARATVKANFGITFYPGCEAELKRGFETGTRLLMLVGEADDWTPAAPCQELARTAQGTRPRIEAYPGAYHDFDGSGLVRVRHDVPNGVQPGQGVHVGSNPDARRLSEIAMLDFLPK